MSSSLAAHDLAATFTGTGASIIELIGPSLNLTGQLSASGYDIGDEAARPEALRVAGRLIATHHRQVLSFVATTLNDARFTRDNPLVLTFELGHEDIPDELRPQAGAALNRFSRFRGIDSETYETLFEALPYEIYVFKYEETGVKYSAYPVSLLPSSASADKIDREPPLRASDGQRILLHLQSMMDTGDHRFNSVTALITVSTRDALLEPGPSVSRAPDIRRAISRDRGPLVGEIRPDRPEERYDAPEDLRRASAAVAHDAVRAMNQFMDANRRSGTSRSVTEVAVDVLEG